MMTGAALMLEEEPKSRSGSSSFASHGADPGRHRKKSTAPKQIPKTSSATTHKIAIAAPDVDSLSTTSVFSMGMVTVRTCTVIVTVVLVDVVVVPGVIFRISL